MAYTGIRPADTQTISQGPADIRDELQGIVTGQIVNAGLLNGIAAGNAAGKIPISNGMVNTNLNADKVDGLDASAFAAASHIHNAATTANSGFMSTADKTKLDGIAAGAQVNQNTFSNVRVGSTTIQADSVADTLELVAGSNIALTPDATNDRVTIAVTGKVANATNADTAAVCAGNAVTASTLATARTIGINGDATGVATAFNGGTNITIPVTLPNSGVTAGTYTSVTVDAKGRVVAGANPTNLGVNITGNANTATKLATVRTINGVSFDGSANITLTAAASGGNADTVGGFLANQLMGGFDGGHALGTNGYQIFSNGLIIQWGYEAADPCPWDGHVFPIAYPNQCFVVFVCASMAGIYQANYATVDRSLITKTKFAGGTYNANGQRNISFQWFAIGN